MASDVIALSRFRAEIARAHRQRAEVLLADPKAAQIVPTLAIQDLYYAIRELGLTDAHELLALASTEQVQGFLDLDGWQRDRLIPERLSPWLRALTELGPKKLGQVIDRLEPETIHLYFLKRTRIYDLTAEEEPPEEPDGPLWPTPDGFYVVEFLGAGDEAAADQHTLDSLYRYDLQLAQQVLMGAKFDLESDLEETAYRFRSARLADLGYVPFEEAMAIYRPVALDQPEAAPTTATLTDQPPLPPVLLRSLDDRLFVVRVLGEERDPAQLERLQGELLLLFNQALSADGIDTAELARVEPVFVRTVGYLGLGLEHLGQRDPAAALAAWKTRGTVYAFRVGVSLVRKLANAARTLVAEGGVRLASGALLLDDPYRAVIEELLRPRPLYPAILDAESAQHGGGRPFFALAEVGRLAQLVAEAALWPRLVQSGLGLSLAATEALAAQYPEATPTFGTILRTLVARLLIDLPLVAGAPLPGAQAGKLAPLFAGGTLAADARARVLGQLENALAEHGLPPLPLPRWLDAVTSDLPARLASGEGLLVELLK